MPDPKDPGNSYRFCGERHAHGFHIFWVDHGIYTGGRNYNCMGYMAWQQ